MGCNQAKLKQNILYKIEKDIEVLKLMQAFELPPSESLASSNLPVGLQSQTLQNKVSHRHSYERSDQPLESESAVPLSKNQFISFDDKELFFSCHAFHISKISIHMGPYITGITVVYETDGKYTTINHIGSYRPFHTEELKLNQFEHIEFISCSYSDEGLHSINFKTSEGKFIMCEGEAGLGQYTKDLNLEDHGKALIGFQGDIQTHILNLWVYVAIRTDVVILKDIESNKIFSLDN